MRRFLASKPVKYTAIVTTATMITGAAAMSSFGWGGGGKIRELSAVEFNSLQNQAALNDALNKLAVYDKSKNDQVVLLFAMHGCPFCARIRAYLDYYGIDYEEVITDPLNGKQLVENPVKTVPQIQFRKRDPANPAAAVGLRNASRPKEAPAALKFDTKEMTKEQQEGKIAALTWKDIPLLEDGPMLADSDVIVQKMSLPLRFNDELESGDTTAQRQDVTTHFQRYVYLSTHCTWARATAAMTEETTGIYRVFPINWMMGAIMLAVCRFKTLKRAEANTKLTFLPNATAQDKSDKMLRDWLTTYIEGKKELAEEKKVASLTQLPITVIDLEMAGVLNPVKDVAHISKMVDECGAREWYTRIAGAIKNQEGKKKLLAAAAAKQ